MDHSTKLLTCLDNTPDGDDDCSDDQIILVGHEDGHDDDLDHRDYGNDHESQRRVCSDDRDQWTNCLLPLSILTFCHHSLKSETEST